MLAGGIWSLRPVRRGPVPLGENGRPRIDRPVLIVMLLFFLVTIVVDGHPGFGSDVGGVLATVPSAAVLLLLLSGVKIGLRRGLMIAAGTLAVLAVFAVADCPGLRRAPTRRRCRARSTAGPDLLTVTTEAERQHPILLSSIGTWVS